MEESNSRTGFSISGVARLSQGTTFGNKRLPSGAIVVSFEDVDEKRSLFQKHIDKLVSLGKGNSAGPLKAKIDELPQIPVNWVAFQRIAELQPAKPIYVLSRDKLTGLYRTLGPNEDDDYVTANGFYEFVIRLDMGGTVFVTAAEGILRLQATTSWYMRERAHSIKAHWSRGTTTQATSVRHRSTPIRPLKEPRTHLPVGRVISRCSRKTCSKSTNRKS